MVRLFRIFRLFKVLRYVAALAVMAEVIKERKEQLIITLIFILFMLLVSSTLMYYVENGQQPDAFGSIPETMWWGVATLTTVGYGDVYPVTVLGKVLGGMIAILGIGLFALPTGILASGFSERLDAFTKNKKQQAMYCPYCGKKIQEDEIHHK
jgi:voltage-gated potassium channel